MVYLTKADTLPLLNKEHQGGGRGECQPFLMSLQVLPWACHDLFAGFITLMQDILAVCMTKYYIYVYTD